MAVLNIRNMDAGAAERIKRAAAARGFTLAEYVARLVDVHDLVREHVDEEGGQLEAGLRQLGMETVHR